MHSSSIPLLRTLLYTACLSLPASAEDTPPPAAPSAAARILDAIPDTAPPPPAPPPPKLAVEPEHILSTTVRETSQRRVLIQKITPLTLRPLPEPAPPADLEKASALRQTLRDDPRRDRLIHLGATVYEDPEDDANTFSLLRLWPTPGSPPGSSPVSLWARINALHLSTFSDFETPDGTRHSMLLMAVRGNRQRPAEHISLPTEKTFSGSPYLVVEGNPTPEQLAPLEALIALCHDPVEGPRLQAAYQTRKAAAEDLARERRENPPGKKTLVLRYWRADRAGQAVINPRPAATR